MDRVITPDQAAKLKQIVNEGTAIMQEIDDLNEGLSETIKAIAEEMEIKPGILKKAIKTAQKGTYANQADDFDTLDTILDVVGRKQ
jgi:hypothetical protein